MHYSPFTIHHALFTILHALFTIHCTVYYTGTQCHALLKDHPQLIEKGNDVVQIQSRCEKDTGRRTKLRHWSRGHLVIIVGSCGHIETWRPIYKYNIMYSYDKCVNFVTMTYYCNYCCSACTFLLF